MPSSMLRIAMVFMVSFLGLKFRLSSSWLISSMAHSFSSPGHSPEVFFRRVGIVPRLHHGQAWVLSSGMAAVLSYAVLVPSAQCQTFPMCQEIDVICHKGASELEYTFPVCVCACAHGSPNIVLYSRFGSVWCKDDGERMTRGQWSKITHPHTHGAESHVYKLQAMQHPSPRSGKRHAFRRLTASPLELERFPHLQT